MSLTVGDRLGHYDVTVFIGEGGGMGQVYRVRDTKLDRDVALKVLPGSEGPLQFLGARPNRKRTARTLSCDTLSTERRPCVPVLHARLVACMERFGPLRKEAAPQKVERSLRPVSEPPLKDER